MFKVMFKVTTLDELTMRVRQEPSVGTCLDAVYSPTNMCKTEEKRLHAKVDCVLDQCPSHVTSLGDLNDTTNMTIVRYVLLPMVLVPGIRTALLNFTGSRRVKIVGSRYRDTTRQQFQSHGLGG